MPRFGMTPFFNPFGLHDLFEQQFRHLDEVFGQIGFGDLNLDLNAIDEGQPGQQLQQQPQQQPSCLHDYYIRPRFDAQKFKSLSEWEGMQRSTSTSTSMSTSTSTDPNKMQVRVDVSQFKPEEITVKTLDDMVVIEGKHERVGENGFVSRHFSRRYVLPPNIEPEKVTSTLAHDGILTIEAPAKKLLEIASNERIVPILRKRVESTEQMLQDV